MQSTYRKVVEHQGVRRAAPPVKQNVEARVQHALQVPPPACCSGRKAMARAERV